MSIDETTPLAGELDLRSLDRRRDLKVVAAFCEEAADYLTLEAGVETGVEAADRFFDDRPPADLMLETLKLGLFDARGRLVALTDLCCGYPGVGDAFIGLLLLAPALRGQGVGRRVVTRLAAMASARGAVRLLIGVLDTNPRGLAFWQSLGFRQVLTRSGVVIGSRTHTIHRLERPLGD